MEDKRTRADHRGDDSQLTQSGGADWAGVHDGGGVTRATGAQTGQLNTLDQPGGLLGGMKFR